MTTNAHLLGIAKVRRSLIVPIVVFTIINAFVRGRGFTAEQQWMRPIYALFDILLWTGVAFLIFAVIERRQKRPPQPRLAAMAMATAGIASLAMAIITTRALFESIMRGKRFVAQWFAYLPSPFFNATCYVALITGIGYAVHSWAVEDRRLAEEAELDAAVARAELRAASGRLQPELLDAALVRLSALMGTNAPAAQRLISDLGALLHDSLAYPQSELVSLGEELQFVERYLDFQRAIGASPIYVSIDVDAEVRSRLIPHFAVLAVVQDAIAQARHSGIDLSIHATTAAGVVKITVSERRDWRVELELPAA
jgi:hypothetical protein